MDSEIFKKMKLKPGTNGIALYAPEDYINMLKTQDYINTSESEKYDFVNLFIESKNDYYTRINEALSKLSDKGVIWISYPKSDKKKTYDVNRDIIFTITPEHGIIACSNIALDEKWSALRFKKL